MTNPITPTAATTTADLDTRRAAVIAGLRSLADFLDQHPDLPTPDVDASLFPRGATDADERATVDHIAAVLGVSTQGSTHYSATRAFGGVRVRACAITRNEMARWQALTSYQGVVEPESDR